MQISHNDTDSPAENVTGVILTGGKSTRMGRDKAALTIDGQSLFERIHQVFARVCTQVQIAGNRPDLATETLPAFADSYPGSSLGGLHNALTNAQTEWVLVLPCDLPYPSPQLLQSLLAGRNGVQAVIPQTSQGIEPLVACYHRSILPLIESRLQRKQLRLIDLLDDLKICYLDEKSLPTGWRRALINLNHPQDVERLHSPPPVVTLVARSGTGKTTLLVKLITELTNRGWTVGALKHDAHRFEIDHQGKDSWKMTAAGAAVTAISSPTKTAVIQQHEVEPEFTQLMQPFIGKVDILLTEGFKRSPLPKIEIHRHQLQQPLLCRGDYDDPSLVAVASDVRLTLDLPCFDLNAPESLATFIEERFLS